jgi:anti-sigma regulatory factor (Ser/Thr protein kinase)
MSSGTVAHTHEPERFRHEALLYDGIDDFVDAVAAFLQDGQASDEPALVVVDNHKIGLLRDALGDATGVMFADMAQVGSNPARIIPAWRDFVGRHASSGRPFRGVGEPIWAERSPTELVECQRHESLLNVAFDAGPSWWLLCPYDVRSLGRAVLEEAARSHPFVTDHGARRASGTYHGEYGDAFLGDLPEPPVFSTELQFGAGPLAAVRDFVLQRCRSMHLDEGRAADLMVVVSELATNSVRHGGGAGTVRLWEDDGALVCEVRDQGRVTDPLVGRVRPTVDSRAGRGLWLVHQLCDLVQIRSGDHGTVVRAYVRIT